MTEPYSTALSLLIIGMTTVFIVLTLVVLTGKTLIRYVNQLKPDVQELVSSSLGSATIAAITAAVDIATEGKGKITNIEKQNQ